MSWEPTIGRWYDEDSYDIKDPLWKRMLIFASQFGEVKDLQKILSWFNSKNLCGDYYKECIIGCFLYTRGVNLTEKFPPVPSILDSIAIAEKSETVNECVLHVMKKANINKEIIDEFKNIF